MTEEELKSVVPGTWIKRNRGKDAILLKVQKITKTKNGIRIRAESTQLMIGTTIQGKPQHFTDPYEYTNKQVQTDLSIYEKPKKEKGK